MKKTKATIIGHFGFGLDLLNGQTVKTKMVAQELDRRFGTDKVGKTDTHGGIKTLFKAPFQIFSALKNSENVIIIPAHNGLRVNAPLLTFMRGMFKGRKLHYVVIGGWLPTFLEKRGGLRNSLKKFDALYVETNTMKAALEAQGFSNVFVMPNFKKLEIIEEDELVYQTEPPYKLCTFSRVMKEKGIETAVNAVKTINELHGKVVFTLDIYGQVDKSQTQWFEDLKASMPEGVSYKGAVAAEKSVEILKDYFALLFPTEFFTEGIPGTILDAYAAGIPVISSKWESFSDVVEDGKTGIGYEFSDESGLIKVLENTLQNPEFILDMKVNCLQRSKAYTPDIAMEPLFVRM